MKLITKSNLYVTAQQNISAHLMQQTKYAILYLFIKENG